VELLAHLPPAARAALLLVGGALCGLAVHALFFRGVARLGQRVPGLFVFDGALLRRTRPPTRLLLPLLGMRWALPLVGDALPPTAVAAAQGVLYVLLVAAVAWLLVSFTRVLDDVVAQRLSASRSSRWARCRCASRGSRPSARG
jgi:hypothetical protein